MIIDWESFKNTYNSWNGTSFESAKDWITYLYDKHNKFVGPVAKELGIGWGTMNQYLKDNDLLEKKPQGGNNYTDRPVGVKEQVFLNIPIQTMKTLSNYQIRTRCNMSLEYCRKLLNKHKREYRRWVREDDYN